MPHGPNVYLLVYKSRPGKLSTGQEKAAAMGPYTKEQALKIQHRLEKDHPNWAFELSER
jgi:hypothetical protein